MTETEQVAVGREDLELLARLYEANGNKAAAFTLRSVGALGRVLEAEAQIIARHRLASTRPISNEEVRGLVERLEVAAPFPVRQQAIATLQHLSAENDRLSAREAEAREIMARHDATASKCPVDNGRVKGDELCPTCNASDDESCGLKDAALAALRDDLARWLKAGEAEHE